MWLNVEQCGTMWNNVEQCGTMWNNVEQCGTMWNNVEQCGTPKLNPEAYAAQICQGRKELETAKPRAANREAGHVHDGAGITNRVACAQCGSINLP